MVTSIIFTTRWWIKQFLCWSFFFIYIDRMIFMELLGMWNKPHLIHSIISFLSWAAKVIFSDFPQIWKLWERLCRIFSISVIFTTCNRIWTYKKLFYSCCKIKI